jgi:phosphoserine phosphatase
MHHKEQCQSSSSPTFCSTTTVPSSSSSSSSSSRIGLNIDAAKNALRVADAVCFDVDSTVIGEEGIDVLAGHLGLYDMVSAVTHTAMQGNMPFQEALRQRLEVMKPTRQHITSCLQHHPATLTPGVVNVIATLHARQTHVYLVSGGFRLMIEPVAERIGISKDRIIANTLWFDDDGTYRGFDTNEFTSRDMGKPAALQYLKDTHGYQTMVMIGDGATDAQAKPPATVFIGFGGVVVREAVKNKADWFITDFNDILSILNEQEASS